MPLFIPQSISYAGSIFNKASRSDPFLDPSSPWVSQWVSVCVSQSLSHGRFFATPWTVPPTLQTFLFLQHNTFFSPLKTFLLAVLSPSNSHTLQQESESEVAQSCPTLCDPIDYSPPGSSIHGIFQARVLEWVAISFSKGSSLHRDRTQTLPHCWQTLYHLSHQGSPSAGECLCDLFIRKIVPGVPNWFASLVWQYPGIISHFSVLRSHVIWGGISLATKLKVLEARYHVHSPLHMCCLV